MKKYQYCRISHPQHDLSIDELNKLGQEGWELIHLKQYNSGGYFAILKGN